MPVYSDQVSGIFAQQNQMFAAYGSFAAGFSPDGPPGMSPWAGGPPPTFEEAPYTAGTKVMGAAHSMMPAAIGMGTLAGSMLLPGALGRAVGNLDPFQAALGGFGRASGITRGIAGQGIMDSIGTMGANIGRIGAGGFGNVVRAGITGLGGAAAIAALPMAGMAAVQYGGGQMIEGAQYTQRVQKSLSQNFRFLNNQSATGFGFSREQSKDIADTMREMGSKDIMSSPGEMLKLMEQGVQGGMFRAVQDAKSFKSKFQEMTKSLKEIAKTFNTTMEGAMPFLTEARRMGFWTPSDVMRLATPTQAAAINTGQSVAQVQAMQQQGAAMARQVGAQGTAGAVGMTNAMSMVGGAIRSGAISEQQLSDMTGGLQGSDAINAYAGQLQAGSTRFAASRQARWLLAATAGKDMRHLDAGKLSLLTSGRMGADQIRGMAEKNIQGRGAEFVMGEEEMRGDMLKMGVEGQAGFLTGIVGKHLFGESGMDQLVTRRLIQRVMGGDAKQADAMAQIMRNLPQIKRDNMRRSEAEADQVARNHDRMMNDSYEGLKRKISHWWRETVDEPLQQAGSDISKGIGDTWERWSDKLWGRTQRGMRNQGVTGSMLNAMRASTFGDRRALDATFASKKEMDALGGGFKGEEIGQLNKRGWASLNEFNGTSAAATDLSGSVPEGARLVGHSIRMNVGSTEKNLNEMYDRSSAALAATMGRKGASAWSVLSGAYTMFAGGIADPSMAFEGAKEMVGGEAYGKGDIGKLYLSGQAEGFKDALAKAHKGDTAGAKADLARLAQEAEKSGDKESAASFRALSRGGAATDAALKQEAGSQRIRNASGLTDVLKRRMGKVDIEKLAGLDEFKGKDKRSLGIGTSLKKIVEGVNKGDIDAFGANDQFAEIAKTIAKMGDSPEARTAAGLIFQKMEEAGLGGMGVGSIEAGAAGIMDIQHAFRKGASASEKAASLSRITGSLGLNKYGKDGVVFSEQTVKGLTSKDSKARSKALASLTAMEEHMDPFEKAQLHDLEKGVQGDMSALVRGAVVGGKQVGLEALSTTQQKDRLDANRVGKKGTMEGIHDQLAEQTRIQNDIKDAVQQTAKQPITPRTNTPNPKDDPKESRADGSVH